MKQTYMLVIVLAVIVMVAAFTTSFLTLAALAEAHGSKSPYTYPVAIDGCLILATFARLHFSLIGKKDEHKGPLFVLVSFTLVSVFLNGLEAWPDLEGAFTFAMMPLAFLASTETAALIVEKQQKVEKQVQVKKARATARATKKAMETVKTIEPTEVVTGEIIPATA